MDIPTESFYVATFIKKVRLTQGDRRPDLPLPPRLFDGCMLVHRRRGADALGVQRLFEDLYRVSNVRYVDADEAVAFDVAVAPAVQRIVGLNPREPPCPSRISPTTSRSA